MVDGKARDRAIVPCDPHRTDRRCDHRFVLRIHGRRYAASARCAQAERRRMKINIEVDCTPEEARRVMGLPDLRSEEHTSELQSLMRISYAVFCLKKKKTTQTPVQIALITIYQAKTTTINIEDTSCQPLQLKNSLTTKNETRDIIH